LRYIKLASLSPVVSFVHFPVPIVVLVSLTPVVARVLLKHLLRTLDRLEQSTVYSGAVVVFHAGTEFEVLKPDVFVLHIR